MPVRGIPWGPIIIIPCLIIIAFHWMTACQRCITASHSHAADLMLGLILDLMLDLMRDLMRCKTMCLPGVFSMLSVSSTSCMCTVTCWSFFFLCCSRVFWFRFFLCCEIGWGWGGACGVDGWSDCGAGNILIGGARRVIVSIICCISACHWVDLSSYRWSNSAHRFSCSAQYSSESCIILLIVATIACAVT